MSHTGKILSTISILAAVGTAAINIQQWNKMDSVLKREDWNKRYLTIQYKELNTNMARIRQQGFEEGVNAATNDSEVIGRVLAIGPIPRSYFDEAPK